MIEYFAGIRVNPDLLGADHIDIAPVFASDMDYAEAYHNSIRGKVEVKWQKAADCIELTLEYPEGAVGFVTAPAGYTVNGSEKAIAASGKYIFKKI
jgi:alpha-L-rhamnosidase